MGGSGGDALSRAGSPNSTASGGGGGGGGKRGRDPEDEVYIDNLHSSKRYLSEIMATSLNGLSFGNAIEDTLTESPQQSESPLYPRDEFSQQYSPMSEDSDECRFSDSENHKEKNPCNSTTNCSIFPHPCNSHSCSGIPHPCNSISSVAARRGSDSEGRFPSSPNDMCHVGDLRRTALLRSVQMRTQPHLHSSHENGESSELEVSSEKSQEDETGYRSTDNEEDII